MSRRLALHAALALSLVSSLASAQEPPQPAPPPQPAAQPAPPPPPPQPAQPGGAPGYAPPAYQPGYAPGPYPPPYGPYPPGYAPGYGAYGEPLPPAPPPKDPGIHLHDGFYLRMGLGIAFIRSNLTLPPTLFGAGSTAPTSQSVHGTGLGLDLAIGGSPAHGVIVGGELLVSIAGSPSSDAPSGAAVSRVSYGFIGPFVDWYPDAKGGFHVQGALGMGVLQYARPNELDLQNTSDGTAAGLSGFAWHAGVGYEGWVGEQWSMGALLRLDGASVKRDDVFGHAEASVFTPGLYWTTTFN